MIELLIEFSHQLITVPGYIWITITSNNLKGIVESNYSAWLNKMVDTRWHEEMKLLIALWREGAVQNKLNTMHNKKLVWVKMDDKEVRSAQQSHV